MIDDLLRNLNDDERFYREYFSAAKRPETLRKFLQRVDVDDARQRHLIIPELLPENISYQMNDEEYFSPDDPATYSSVRTTDILLLLRTGIHSLRSPMSIREAAPRISAASA